MSQGQSLKAKVSKPKSQGHGLNPQGQGLNLRGQGHRSRGPGQGLTHRTEMNITQYI